MPRKLNLPQSDAELRLRGQIAANTSWANTSDRTARTEPGRQAMLRKFEQQVDPSGVLTPAERTKRAENLRGTHAAVGVQVREGPAATQAGRCSLMPPNNEDRASRGSPAAIIITAQVRATETEGCSHHIATASVRGDHPAVT